MSKILVTGVTGAIGKSTVKYLLKKGIPSTEIAGLSRKGKDITDLTAKGIEVRLGDYSDYDSLVRAFKGVNKVMLTSAVAFTDRAAQHYNVITAAHEAGVKHVVYMAIMRKAGSERIMPEITESDLLTEQLLKSSGGNYTIVYHPPFTDVLSIYYGGNPYDNGIKVPAGNGKMAPAVRDELAEAHAEILATDGHENKSYSLGGSEAISFADIAKVLEDVKGKPVPFSTIPPDLYIEEIVAKGASPKVAEFLTNWVVAISEGEFEYRSGDLEQILGRKAKNFRAYVESNGVGAL